MSISATELLTPEPAMFKVSQLASGYGQSKVIHDVDLSVAKEEIVAVMGRNGMGKTTLFKTLMGILPLRAAASASMASNWAAWKATSASSAAWPTCRRGA
jgi:ABC-type branched-subunit amino acid transport system ATPase component